MQLGYSILVSTSGFQFFGRSLQAPANAQTCLLAEAETSRSAWYPRMQVLVEFVLHGSSSAFPCPHTQRSGISPRTGRFNMCVERSSATQGGPAFSEWACCGVRSGLPIAGWLQPRAVVYNRRAGVPWITEGSGRGTWRAWCSPVAPVGVKVCGCAVCGRRMVRAPRRFRPLPPPRHTPGGRLRRDAARRTTLAVYTEHNRL